MGQKIKKKKNNSLKLFNKIAKRAYKVSKKRELDWKWSDAQKWTSKNIFQKYKGTKNLSKLKVTEIDNEITGILDGVLLPTGKPLITKPITLEVCFSPFDVASYLLDSFEWFDIQEKVSILNDDLKVDLDLEYQGTIFAKTGVVKKSMLPNLLKLREDMRKSFVNASVADKIECFIVHIEGTEDNTDIACNYYVLITFENSSAFNYVNSRNLIRKVFVPKGQMPISEQERIEQENKIREEERKKLTKKKAQSFKLPSNVEPKKAEPLKEPTIKDTKTSRLTEYNKAIEKLESLFDKKLITKKQFQERFKELGKNLEDGGEL